MTRIAIELTAPVIDTHRQSSTGVDFVHSFESGLPGPHVMVNAVTHGNEICGALVVDRLLRMGLRPTRGTLTLSFANIDAFSRFDPKRPYATRFIDEDFNRVWNPETLDGPRDSTELRRARALRPFVEAADYLLDIHSMLEPSPPVMICGPLDKGIRFAFDIGIPKDVVSDEGHANGTRMRDCGGFGDPASAEERAAGGVRAALGARLPSTWPGRRPGGFSTGLASLTTGWRPARSSPRPPRNASFASPKRLSRIRRSSASRASSREWRWCRARET